ncbi:hypothetical protein C5167_019596 [Papaver somniferum]|uniref:Uncharacterized protein n=1 Tax=Papaver somniferum TaxID=3469 RepID=A0A4Y7ITX9_PAPSO|nr:hypothetical protein C5167_019596 [Papaver somniferum]
MVCCTERCIKFTEDSWFNQFCIGANPWMARYVYGFIFLIINLLAWGVRDYGHGALTEMERFKGCKGGKYCLGTEGVLRVSLVTNFGLHLFGPPYRVDFQCLNQCP